MSFNKYQQAIRSKDMVDDAYYITPHETALAVVATAMKKARLRLDTLVVNSLVGGALFSAGGMLFLASHAENPEMVQNNPGLISFLGAFTFSIGLFYVVINGADLFNSNILFFSVGVLRNAVSVYDMLISWFISWICNIGGTLFVCYVICHLSGATSSDLYIKGSHEIVDAKASFTFIENFIKGIAGNFYVCLAVYLQLMVKPLHVKLIVMTLPIFTFVAMGFTHVVADMYLLMMGMINGADLSVGKYIWKLLIPSTLGNIVGGSVFGAVIPFYLHLVVVERDRKRLALPEYEARDEQPELNVDSRVVRIPPEEAAVEEEEGETSSDGLMDDYYKFNDHRDKTRSNSSNSYDDYDDGDDKTSEKYQGPVEYRPNPVPDRGANRPHVVKTTSALSRVSTTRSGMSLRSRHSQNIRSPPGVFPVRGMGKPLIRERNIVDPEYTSDLGSFDGAHRYPAERDNADAEDVGSFDMISTNSEADSSIEDPIVIHAKKNRKRNSRGALARASSATLQKKKTLNELESDEECKYEEEGGYNVRNHKMGTRLEKALSRIATHVSKEAFAEPELPRTTQDLFPHNQLSQAHTIANAEGASKNVASPSVGGLFRTFSKTFLPTKPSNNMDEIHRRLSEAGITSTAARASDNIAGVENYDGIDLPASHSPFYNRRSSQLSSPSITLGMMGTSNSAGGGNGGGGTSVAGNRRQSNLRNILHFDNDDFEEQSIRDF